MGHQLSKNAVTSNFPCLPDGECDDRHMATKKKSAKGKRYTPEEKKKIIDYVNQVDAERGRGGRSAASKKFGVSPLTLGSWIAKGAGAATPRSLAGTKGKKSPSGGKGTVLEQLVSLDREIAMKRSELSALEDRFEKLKAKL